MKILKFDSLNEKISYVGTSGIYKVYHKHFCTDHYESHPTLVKASSEQEAMDILNEYLSTKPDGVYTADPCKSVEDVYEVEILCKI